MPPPDSTGPVLPDRPTRVEGWADDVADLLDRRRTAALGVFSVAFLATGCWLGSRSKMTYDEYLSAVLARSPTIGALTAVLRHGPDATPPLYHVVTWAVSRITGGGELSISLPSVVGFWVMMLCIYFYVGDRDRGASFAWAAMLLPLTSRFVTYVAFARPYGMLLGWTGLAMLSWRAATRGRRYALSIAALGVSTGAGVATHYYFIFVPLAIALGETVRAASRRRIDVPVWVAVFVGGVVGSAACLPFLENSRDWSLNHHTNPSSPGQAVAFWARQFPGAAPMVVSLLAILAFYTPRRWTNHGPNEDGPPAHETVAALGLCAAPVFGVALGELATGTFADRYAIPALFGVAVLVGSVGKRQSRGSGVPGLAMALVFLAYFLGVNLRVELSKTGAGVRQQYASYTAEVSSRGQRGEPIVVTHRGMYARMKESVSGQAGDPGQRLVLLVGPGEETRFRQPLFRSITYPALVAGRDRFLLLCDAGERVASDLERDGFRLQQFGPVSVRGFEMTLILATRRSEHFDTTEGGPGSVVLPRPTGREVTGDDTP